MVRAEGIEAVEGLRTSRNKARIDSRADVRRWRGWRRNRTRWSMPWRWSVPYVDAAEDTEHLYEPRKLLQSLSAPVSSARSRGDCKEKELVELQLD